MKEMTKENLKSAFAGESQAHIKYLAFSAKAEKEGKPNIARLFHAIAYAEQVHAINHLKELGGVGDTVANLEAAIGGENFEVDEMYAAYLAVAEVQGEKGAKRSMTYAIEAEKIHAEMYADAKAAAEAGEDMDIGTVYICPVCGFTHIGEPPDRCPVCNVKKEQFQSLLVSFDARCNGTPRRCCCTHAGRNHAGYLSLHGHRRPGTMKTALILNAISPQIGGVLIRGERGTAKSTAARALAALLPEIEVVADCPFNCDPHRPERLCDNCRERVAEGETLPVARRTTRFVDLPVSATEDRVVGTLDIERAIKTGRKKFEPGVLAAANRGLLYVDEVNLLDDHVVDLLLDSAAMGVNVVEREGISFSHPARFILVGTMNPEEGELRPQLLDRFALCVEIRGIADPQARVDILERTVQFESDPEGFRAEWEPYEEQLSQRHRPRPRAAAGRDLPATRPVHHRRADHQL